MIRDITRRDALRIATGAGGLALAGCLGDDGDDTADAGGSPTPGTDDPGVGGSPTPDEETGSPERPATGEEVAELAVLDETVLEYMAERDIDAGALAVARDGEVVLERGYGWADPDRSEPLPPDAIFRIGSISKGFTAAAVNRLVAAGDLDPEDRVLDLLDVEPPGGDPADERFRDVTVGHLRAHEGGWDARQAGDPMYEPLAVKEHLGLDGLPEKRDFTRYMLDQPMQFDPGENQVYSNFGYVLLGQVVEAVTGTDYQSHLEGEIFDPVGVDGIDIGSIHPDDRPPEEVWYDDGQQCRNVFESDEQGPCADVGFLLEPFDAAGGHVSSARSLVEYLDDYWLTGDPRDGEESEAIYFGSHPGNFAMARQYPGGVDAVALFNRRVIPLQASQAIDDMLADAFGELGWI